MAVITISATRLGQELISGIPMLVSLDTNVPATIYYTLDGSEPTIYSQIYLNTIIMPTSGTTRLRALAISGQDQGIFDVVYFTDSTELAYHRRLDDYGIGVAVDAYDVENVVVDGYSSDAQGNIIVPSRASDYDLDDLEIKFSETGVGGEGPGTMIRMGPMSLEQREEMSAVDWSPTTPNDQNAFFNPRSLYITIDGRDGYEDQIVSPHVIINKPLTGTRDSIKYLQGKEMYEPQPYISGGLVRTHYNYETGTAVSYYFDHNETRWVKSIQNFDPQTVPQGVGSRRQTGPPLVFKWVYNKRSMI
ncbi:MAG: chitobiase/beta-hexosaminidase C-terminal domain-containing protein [Planctomycetota bacterium]|jgi:hypothetical protein